MGGELTVAQVTTRTLGRNSLYAGILQVWQVISRFVITPVIIMKLGLDGYGTWTLLFGICSYISMFDTSFGLAYMKFTAELDQKADYRRLSAIVGSGMALATAIGAVGLVLIEVFRWRILTVLNVPGHLLPDAGGAVMIIALCFVLRMSIGSVYQVLAGLQRIDLQYKLTMLSSVLEFGIGLTLLSLGRGLLGLAIAHLCGQVAAIGIGRFLCWRLCPALTISPFQVSRDGLRQVISLGGRFQVLSLLNTVVTQGTKMLLSGVCGVSMLALFELADKLVGLGRTISTSIIAPLMPAFASLHAGHERGRSDELYVQVSRLVALTAAGSLGFLFAFADRLIILWTGQDYPLAAWTIRIMVPAEFLILMTGAGTASLRGQGVLYLEFYYTLACSLLIGLLLVPAALWGGYFWIVLMMVTGQVVGALGFLAAFSRREHIRFAGFARRFLVRPFVLGTAVTLLALELRPAVDRFMPIWPIRWASVLEVAMWVPVYAAAAGGLFWYAMFSASERQRMVVRLFAGRPKDPEGPATTTETP